MTDQQAIERYKYMLRTAPPDAIEAAHEEAFGRLTPEQRKMALEQLSANASPAERDLLKDDPRSLARAATRAEMKEPGILERMFGRAHGSGGFGAGGMGMGGMLAGSLLAGMAGSVIGSAVAHQFFDNDAHESAATGDEGQDHPGDGDDDGGQDASEGLDQDFGDGSDFG